MFRHPNAILKKRLHQPQKQVPNARRSPFLTHLQTVQSWLKNNLRQWGQQKMQLAEKVALWRATVTRVWAKLAVLLQLEKRQVQGLSWNSCQWWVEMESVQIFQPWTKHPGHPVRQAPMRSRDLPTKGNAARFSQNLFAGMNEWKGIFLSTNQKGSMM